MKTHLRFSAIVVFVCAAAVFILGMRLNALQSRIADLAGQVALLAMENESLKLNSQATNAPSEQTTLELLRLRNEVSLLRRQTNALMHDALAAAAPVEDAQPVPAPIPAESWTYSGYATPEAAFQSAAWAMRAGNLGAYLDCFPAEARARAAERFEGKDAVQVQRMLFMEIAKARALRPDRKVVLEDGSVAFPISSVEHDDGVTVTKEERMLRFRNVAGEWKFMD